MKAIQGLSGCLLLVKKPTIIFIYVCATKLNYDKNTLMIYREELKWMLKKAYTITF